MSGTLRLSTLQTVRMKGRPSPGDVAWATGASEAEVGVVLDELVQQGLLVAKGEQFRLTPEGKEALAARLDEERSGIDSIALRELYEDFTPVNADFKQMVTDWQQRDGQPNDHSDKAYDRSVLARLDDIDARLAPLLGRAAETVPRLRSYAHRFAAALRRVRDGDHAWFLRPIIDSYHTVWFEFHEELIQLAGLSRAEEAAAGRAE